MRLNKCHKNYNRNKKIIEISSKSLLTITFLGLPILSLFILA